MKSKLAEDEGVGPLDLPRSGSMWWLQLLFFLFIVTSGALSVSLKRPLKESFGWNLEDAKVIADLLSNSILAAIAVLCFWWLNRSNPRLTINRGREFIPLSTQPGIEVWARNSRSETVVPVVICLVLSAVVAWSGFDDPSRASRIRALILLALLVYLIWHSVREWLHPLLILDELSAVVRGTRFQWTQMQRVEVQHRVSFFGDWISVRVTFFDVGGRKMAAVSLPKDQCGLLREEALVEFIAARLGRRYEHLALPALDWL